MVRFSDYVVFGPPPPYRSGLPKGMSADQFRQERNSQCGYVIINPDDDSDDEGKFPILFLFSKKKKIYFNTETPELLTKG